MSTTPETAVQRCVDEYYKACDREDPQNTGLSDWGWKQVKIAYRHAMPFLTNDPDAIDAFVACVTHGLIFQVFDPAETSKLLYAAQVAIGSRRARTEAARHQSKSQTESKPQPAATPSPLPLHGAEGAVGPTAGGAQIEGPAPSLSGSALYRQTPRRGGTLRHRA